MKKLLLLIAGMFAFASSTYATASVSWHYVALSQGWNVFSTPNVLGDISFSNTTGSNLYFYTLSGSTWQQVLANTGSIRPLEGYLVNNTSTGTINMGLGYKAGLLPAEMLFSKNLTAGWNLLGVTTTNNPFSNIGSAASMSVDFTRTSNGSSNLTNAVNVGFNTTNGNASVGLPQLSEAYAVFMNAIGVYGGNQDPVAIETSTGIALLPDVVIDNMFITSNYSFTGGTSTTNAPIAGTDYAFNRVNLTIRNAGNGVLHIPAPGGIPKISLGCNYDAGGGGFSTVQTQATLNPGESLVTQIETPLSPGDDIWEWFTAAGSRHIRCEVMTQQQQGWNPPDANYPWLIYESDGTNNAYQLNYTVLPFGLSASANGAFVSEVAVRGALQAKIGSFAIENTNNEAVNITSLWVSLSTATGIYDTLLKVGGTQIGSTLINPSLSNTFAIGSGALNIPANGQTIVDVYAHIHSTLAATGSLTVSLTASGSIGVGAVSGASMTAPANTVASNPVNVVSAGTLSVEADSLTPAKQILVAQMTNVEVLRFKVRANNSEDIRLDKVYLGAGSGSTVTDLGRNFTNVKLYDGTNQIGAGSITFVGNSAHFTGLNLTVARSSSKSISVRVDTTNSSVLEKWLIAKIAPTAIEYTGLTGGNLTPLASVANTLAPSQAMTMHDVKPVITNVKVNTTATPSANQEIGAYSIRAEGVRDLTLSGVRLTLSSFAPSTGTLTNVEVWYNNAVVAPAVASITASGGTATFTFTSPITITAGSTITLYFKANTSAIRNGVTMSTVSLGTTIDGNSNWGDLSWSYADVNGAPSGPQTISDNYPVTGAVLTY